MKFLTIGEFSERLHVTVQTVRNWNRTGKLLPHHVSSGGHRYYTEEQLLQMSGVRPKERVVVGYCRVSSIKQQDDLERQVECVRTYMLAKGYKFQIITDVGSGINYDKKGLNQLLNKITLNEVEKIIVLYKDRLVRFGFELIENLCKLHGTTIEIIDNTEKTEEQELVEDLVQIITVFSCRLQGKRANKAKKLLKELVTDDPIEKS